PPALVQARRALQRLARDARGQLAGIEQALGAIRRAARDRRVGRLRGRPPAARRELAEHLLQMCYRLLAHVGLIERAVEERVKGAFAQRVPGAGPPDDEPRLWPALVALAEAAVEHLDRAVPARGGKARRHFAPQADDQINLARSRWRRHCRE